MRLMTLLLCVLSSLTACGGDQDGALQRVADAPEDMTFVDVWAFSPTDVWLLDGGPAIHRYDGTSFSPLETPAGWVSCIFALSPTDVWLCAGDDALHYDGAAFTPHDVAGPTGLSGLSDLWASSPSDVWAVGNDAIIAHYDGQTWSRTLAGSPFKTSIWGAGATDVYALDTFGLVHYDGSGWEEIDLDSGGGDGQVWGTGPEDVWVMTGSYELSHFDGASWEAVELDDFIGDLTAVWGPAPDDLWAAGSAGSIARYDGERWREVAHQKIGAPYLRMFVAVHGSSSDNVWAVGQQLGEGGSTGIVYRGGR